MQTLLIYTPLIHMDIPKLERQIEPLGDRVVVFPAQKETETSSGIVLPENDEKQTNGFVIAIGKGGMTPDSLDPNDFLNVGDEVLFGKYAGDDISVKTENNKDITVKILQLDQILGVIN